MRKTRNSDQINDVLCRELIREQLHSAAAVPASPRAAVDDGGYRKVSEPTGLRTFVTTLVGHVAGAGA